MAKARLYLDVDGCINLFGASPWPSGKYLWGEVRLLHDGFGQKITPSGGWAASENPVYTIRWAPELIEELNVLDVELVWLTTWCHNAPDLIAPLVGLTLPSRVLEPLSGQVSFPSIEWKMEALGIERMTATDMAVWIDDETSPDWFDFDGLRIQPDPNFGITPAHIEQIKNYLEG